MSDLAFFEPEHPQWYALYTKPRCEKKVGEHLEKNEIQFYLPLIKHYNPSRRISFMVPLIPSYVFINIPMSHDFWYKIINSAYVVSFVNYKKIPQPIPDYEIDSLIKVVQNVDISESIKLNPVDITGKLVKIIEGPFAGLIGRVSFIKPNKKKIVINIENIALSVAVEVNAEYVQKIEDFNEF